MNEGMEIPQPGAYTTGLPGQARGQKWTVVCSFEYVGGVSVVWWSEAAGHFSCSRHRPNGKLYIEIMGFGPPPKVPPWLHLEEFCRAVRAQMAAEEAPLGLSAEQRLERAETLAWQWEKLAKQREAQLIELQVQLAELAARGPA